MWLSIIFHSQTDKQTEHQNQTLKHYLHCYFNEKQDNWVNLLSLAEFAYINTKQATINAVSSLQWWNIMFQFITMLRTMSEKKKYHSQE
jgi:hypothetical protein